MVFPLVSTWPEIIRARSAARVVDGEADLEATELPRMGKAMGKCWFNMGHYSGINGNIMSNNGKTDGL